MSEDALNLETAVMPRDSTSVVTRQGRQSTIHHLPVELLAEIFVQCIPPLVPSEKYKLPTFDSMSPDEIQKNLALVCRLWRNVLNHEPRVWGTLSLYNSPKLENVSLWLKRSKSCPLDVYIDEWLRVTSEQADAITELLYNELSRIRSLFATDYFMDRLSTFPAICDGHTILPWMESLNLINFEESRDWEACFSFPRLRTLVIRNFDLCIDGSMPDVHHLDMAQSDSRSTQDEEGIDEPCWSYQLLQLVPNLVSLTWNIHVTSEPLDSPVYLPFLKSLILPTYGRSQPDTLDALECFVAPSLENLDLDLGDVAPPRSHEVMLTEALDVICRDGSVQLRHLTLRSSPQLENCQLEDLRAISPHLSHLDTFTIDTIHGRLPFDPKVESDPDYHVIG